jgi:hypothetical protein
VFFSVVISNHFLWMWMMLSISSKICHEDVNQISLIIETQNFNFRILLAVAIDGFKMLVWLFISTHLNLLCKLSGKHLETLIELKFSFVQWDYQNHREVQIFSLSTRIALFWFETSTSCPCFIWPSRIFHIF